MSPGLVDAPAAWAEARAAISVAGRLALDVEADGFHRYPERVALLQVALPDGSIYLVDPLASLDLSALGARLADPAVPIVVHSGSYDVRGLDRDLGFRIRGLYDTSIAAAFCGMGRLGLATVLEEVLGVTLDKPKRLQRFDWSTRPLPGDALAYAAGDVAHLLALADALAARVAGLGRTAWVAEECARLEAVRHAPPAPPEEAFLRVRGARELDARGRAVLRELVVFREGEALRLGRPPHFVFSNEAMLALSAAPDAAPEGVPGIGRHVRGPAAARLREALRRGRAAPPVPWPAPRGPNPWTTAARARLARLKRWRTGEAQALGLDPGMVWPAVILDRLALDPSADPADLDTDDPPVIRRWQMEALGASLRAFVAAKGA